MKTIFSPLAEKQFKKLSRFIQVLITKKVRQIQVDSIVTNSKRLTGYKDIFRIRVGDYRMIYRNYPDKIYFILIGHRREIYKLLERI